MGKVKSFFVKIGRWFKNHAPTRRRIIQIYSALLFNANIKGLFGKGDNIIYHGGTKNLCAPGLNCYSCPGAVAACPLGALQNSLMASDRTTPYFILGILGVLGLMLGRTICGFLCPVGLGQELLYKIKTPKLKKSRYTRILSYFKYVLLVVFVIAIPLIYSTVPAFCKYICPAGTSASVLQLANGNNSDLYGMLGFLFSWKFLLLIAFIVLSVFIFRFFCRFICPLGAIYGFFNKIALIGVKLDEQKCIDCGLCVQTCKMDISKVGDHECINCGECIRVCPTQAISWKGSKIFLPKSEIAKPESVTVESEEKEVKPLTAILASGTAAETANTVKVTSTSGVCQAVTVESNGETCYPDGEKVKKASTPTVTEAEKKFRKRAFWLEFAAWALAAAVLITALVYYNFLAPTDVTAIYKEGDRCPDFTLETVFETDGAYGEDGNKIEKFSMLENRGTVTVLNYWYTDCGPCIAELPGFNRVKEEFGDEINVIAIHARDMTSNAVIQSFLDERSNIDSVTGEVTYWKNYSITFALDTNTYKMLGGKSTYPMTVIIDKNGVISFVKQGSLTEDLLRTKVQEALNG
ncbi:MAG: 4Fe-4S binding protein [Clostridia bacterium]|nr:4Fe-4S binding protein [Clostridia bacterium]